MMRKITLSVRFGKKFFFIYLKFYIQVICCCGAEEECEAGNLGDTGSCPACVSTISTDDVRLT